MCPNGSNSILSGAILLNNFGDFEAVFDNRNPTAASHFLLLKILILKFSTFIYFLIFYHSKVILIPRTHVDTIWKRTFEETHNGSVRKIISNIVKKLQFYSNLTFAWNEVSHLSQWWKTATPKNRAVSILSILTSI